MDPFPLKHVSKANLLKKMQVRIVSEGLFKKIVPYSSKCGDLFLELNGG